MCTYSSIGVSSLTNYLSARENLWNYPPPSLPNNKTHHVVMAAAAEKAAQAAAARRACKTAPNYQPFDDYLGLSGMLQTLNVSEPINMAPGGHRARLGSDGAEMFDDFRANGVDAELDDFDRIIHKLRSEDGGSPPCSNQSSSSISPASASPPTSSMSSLNPNLAMLEPNLAMLELLRERERRAVAAQQQQQLLAAASAAVLPPLPPVTPSSRVSLPPPASSRRSRHGSGGSGGSSGQTVCVFCRNNGEPVHVYTAHYLKDATGRVTCPILRAYKCPYCRASGDNAHTKTYCPLAISALGEAPLSAERVLAKQTTRSSCGKKRNRALTGVGSSGGMLQYPSSISPPLHLLAGLHAFD